MIIDEAIQISELNLKKKGITCYKKKCKDIPPIKIFEERLKHILINIILNAADQLEIFRAYGKIINIETIYDLDDLVFPFKIRISDNACGIHTALQGKIFDFLYTTKKDGMGLGLFICKSLITSMGGEIEVEKSLMYLGTSFLIKLPDTREKNG
jgi:signal transduction histidine kinase